MADKPWSMGDAADMLGELRKQMQELGDLEQRHSQITATATVHEKRVTVTVNAAGHVIDVRFSDSVSALSYSEIATAVVSAAKAAVAEATRQGEELIAPLREGHERMPRLHELIDGLPNFESEMTVPPPLLSELPKAEDGYQGQRTEAGTEITDSGWDSRQ